MVLLLPSFVANLCYKKYFRGEATKVKPFVQKDASTDLETLRCRAQRLDAIFDKYNALVEALVEEGEFADEMDLEDYYNDTLAKAKEIHNATNSRSVIPVSNNSLPADYLKLPQITLLAFSEKYAECRIICISRYIHVPYTQQSGHLPNAKVSLLKIGA